MNLWSHKRHTAASPGTTTELHIRMMLCNGAAEARSQVLVGNAGSL